MILRTGYRRSIKRFGHFLVLGLIPAVLHISAAVTIKNIDVDQIIFQCKLANWFPKSDN